MRVAYRRMSGAVGVSNLEQGTRGLWWEKRLALVRWLKSRGHTVDFINRMMKYSPPLSVEYSGHDVLVLEFGSRNKVFYGKDLDETQRLVELHAGPIVFVCDDPDLPYLWETVSEEKKKQFTSWVNCLHPDKAPKLTGGTIARDFPFSALQDASDPLMQGYAINLVYIGRPNGREKTFHNILAVPDLPLEIFAKPSEWKEFGVFVGEPPAQVDRKGFYATSLGCLAIADAKHKKLGWRTGRAYHAALAGCPVVAEHDHPGLSAFTTFREAGELLEVVQRWRDPHERARVVKQQRLSLADDRGVCELRARELGL